MPTLSQNYAKLVEIDLVDHINGRKEKTTEVPSSYLKEGHKLSPDQLTRLSAAVSNELDSINDADDEQLLQKYGAEDHETLKLILEVAGQLEAVEKLKTGKAQSATDKWNRVSSNPGEPAGVPTGVPAGEPTGVPTGDPAGGNTAKTTKKVKIEDSDGESDSEFGDVYFPGTRGRERSASPMQEGAKRQLEEILRAHCRQAVPDLKKYLSGDSSLAESLAELNTRMQTAISDSLRWPATNASQFHIPYDEFKRVINPEVVQPFQAPDSEENRKYFSRELGKSRLVLHHLCLGAGLRTDWLEGLLETEIYEEKIVKDPLYNEENTDITKYWPYSFLKREDYTVIFEKTTRKPDGKWKSSYGVQVYDRESRKFRVEMRPSIGGDLQSWRHLPNAYKFNASERGYKGGKESIKYVYFFTTKQPEKGGPESRTSAHADVCVRSRDSVFPIMLQRSQVNQYLPYGECIELIMENLSHRDDIKEPWNTRAKQLVYDLTGEEGRYRPRTNLEQEHWKMLESGNQPLRGASPYSRASLPPDIETPATDGPSPFTRGLRSFSHPPVAEKQSELTRLGKEIDNIIPRLEYLEKNSVTLEHLKGALNEQLGQIAQLLGRPSETGIPIR